MSRRLCTGDCLIDQCQGSENRERTGLGEATGTPVTTGYEQEKTEQEQSYWHNNIIPPWPTQSHCPCSLQPLSTPPPGGSMTFGWVLQCMLAPDKPSPLPPLPLLQNNINYLSHTWTAAHFTHPYFFLSGAPVEKSLYIQMTDWLEPPTCGDRIPSITEVL